MTGHPTCRYLVHVTHNVAKAINVPGIPMPSAILSLLLYPPPLPAGVGVEDVEVGVDDVEVDVGVGEVAVDVGFGVVGVDDEGTKTGVVTAATVVYIKVCLVATSLHL
jgi:hypothetical protein